MTFAIVVLAAGTVAAQGGGGRGERGGRGGFNMGAMMAPMIAVAADKDFSGDVSGAEWKGFFSGLKTDKDGFVDTGVLATSIFTQLMDKDKDGKLEVSDLDVIHKELDKNSDGILQREEAFGRGGRGDRGNRGGRRGGQGGGEGGGGLLSQDDEPKKEEKKETPNFAARYTQQALGGMTQLADKDSNREITIDEWKEFKGGLKVKDGILTAEQVTALMKGPEREAAPEGEAEGRRGRRGGARGARGFDSMLTRVLAEKTKADVEGMFKELDKNEDSALQAEELQRQRRGGRRPV